MTKDVRINFKVDQLTEDTLGRATVIIDKNKSEIIRTCILLSLHTVVANPALCNMVNAEHFSDNNISALQR